MSRIYDNWEKLVEAVLRREKDRQLALCESFKSSSSADLSSRFSSFSFGTARSQIFSGGRLDEKVTRVEAAVTFFLDNVQNLLVEEIDLILGAEKEMMKLRNELELMKAILRASKQEKGEVFIQSGREIMEAVYEAEDTLDACLKHKAKGSGSLGLKNLDLAKKMRVLLRLLQFMSDQARIRLNALPRLDASAARPGASGDEKLKKDRVESPRDRSS